MYLTNTIQDLGMLHYPLLCLCKFLQKTSSNYKFLKLLLKCFPIKFNFKYPLQNMNSQIKSYLNEKKLTNSWNKQMLKPSKVADASMSAHISVNFLLHPPSPRKFYATLQKFQLFSQNFPDTITVSNLRLR